MYSINKLYRAAAVPLVPLLTVDEGFMVIVEAPTPNTGVESHGFVLVLPKTETDPNRGAGVAPPALLPPPTSRDMLLNSVESSTKCATILA